MSNRVDPKMFVAFGERAFICVIEKSEIGNLPGHTYELAKAVHVLQRVITRFDWEDGEFDGFDRAFAGVGLDFLTGIIAQMLAINEKARVASAG